MELQEFTQKIAKALSEYLGGTAEVKEHKIYKNNGILLHGICALEKGKNIAPTIYVNEFYERYQKGEDISRILKDIVKIMDKNRVEDNIDVDFFNRYENVRKHLVIRLIHKEKNRELLEEVPYQIFMDLALVCHCVIVSEEFGHGEILIHKHHLEAWKIDASTLFRDAFENSPRLEPGRVLKMSDMIKEILREHIKARIDQIAGVEGKRKEELLKESMENMAREIEAEAVPMYVLTNVRRYYGASCLAYPGILKRIAEGLKGDFYILPSSVHEVILMKNTEEMESVSLNEMIQEVNRTQVAEEEWLSDHAYLYQKDTGKLIWITRS